jgi:hypothetical protein
VRLAVLLALIACTKTPSAGRDDTRATGSAIPAARGSGSAAGSSGSAAAASPTLPAHAEYPDLGTAIVKTIPDGARVVGFGELHNRTDRAQVASALARFTSDGLPAIADRLSDLVVETWIVDGKCGSAAQEATAKVTVTMRRPQETKSEIGLLADAARKAKIQPHAMRITCDDYSRMAPPGKDVQPEALLDLTTRELGRISSEAVAHRDQEPAHRPWVAVYGGALHNDRFPDPGVADWSYAAKADAATGNHFVEIDLIVPELAAADAPSQKQPWFPLVAVADNKVRVWQRGERSFVIVLQKTTP